jgi:D-sedoheptulose 7-phosphate isomerase
MSENKIINDYIEEVKRIANEIVPEDIIKVVDIIYKAWEKQKTVFICGNGGSASTASHFTCDLVKLGVKVQCLNDNPSLITAITNDSGFNELYREQLAHQFGQRDVLILFSVHGGTMITRKGKIEMYRGKKLSTPDVEEVWSANIINAAQFVKTRYGDVIGFIGYDGGLVKQFCEVSIILGNSTPQVESWHVHIEHLICLLLKERIDVCQRL